MSRRQAAEARAKRLMSASIAATAHITAVRAALNVTPTWIGAARGLEGALTSGRGGGSPRPERFFS